MENQWKKIVTGGVIISREVQEITYCKYMWVLSPYYHSNLARLKNGVLLNVFPYSV